MVAVMVVLKVVLTVVDLVVLTVDKTVARRVDWKAAVMAGTKVDGMA